jgi:hypothetical protein
MQMLHIVLPAGHSFIVMCALIVVARLILMPTSVSRAIITSNQMCARFVAQISVRATSIALSVANRVAALFAPVVTHLTISRFANSVDNR